MSSIVSCRDDFSICSDFINEAEATWYLQSDKLIRIIIRTLGAKIGVYIYKGSKVYPQIRRKFAKKSAKPDISQIFTKN